MVQPYNAFLSLIMGFLFTLVIVLEWDNEDIFFSLPQPFFTLLFYTLFAVGYAGVL